ncbi:MAG: DUF5686 and carboxypeptidase regulatory-like domain-containing protein [Rikenellaceae bacterium]|nr:DUF5686 and carboxypeptidase regulatory-like domain-containing protein [Rikenellaceae bacterium]
MKRSALFIIILFCAVTSAFGQVTKVRGRVSDARTGEPLAFASVTFPGTWIGTTTDTDGIFSIETRQPVTEVTVVMLSYVSQTQSLTEGVFNEIDFMLEPSATAIDEVVVRPGENPAHAMLKKISAHKPLNNPDYRETYSYEAYTKMELNLANMKEEFRNKKMQKNFGFVFEYMDTSAVTGRKYLPVMISESVSENYYRRSPRLRREVIKGSRISGVENDYTFSQFTGGLHVNVNLYENYINILEVNFPGPLCEHGLMYYDYFLVDSLHVEGRKNYLIRFHPKNTATPVFDGEIHIDSLTWGLRYAKMRMPAGVNVNWISELLIENENRLVGDSVWFPVRDNITAEFSVRMREKSEMTSFLVTRQIDYSNVTVDRPLPDEVLGYSTNVVYARDVIKSDEEYWENVRPWELTEREKNIYVMVEEIKDAPLYKNIVDVINTALFGFYQTGKVEWGPYYKLYSFNKMEGNRFQLGVRTTTDMSERVRLYGYAAYGTKDREMKGGGTAEFMFSNLPTSKLTLSAKRDVTHLGASSKAFTTGNIMGSLFSRRNNDRLTLLNQYDASYEKEWRDGLTNTFGVEYRKIYANDLVRFTRPTGESLRSISNTELRAGMRLTWNEVVVRQPFDKYIVQSPLPVIDLRLAGAASGLPNNVYNYLRAELDVRYDINIPPLGKSKLTVSGGNIFGKVPYPLLKLHEGNATYFYDPLAFSCMHFYEFASDLWGSLFWEHHFGGFFLGRVPVLKKLKWREVVTAKALWGRISDRNNSPADGGRADLLFPEGMSSLRKPYVEAGVGIENIFRVFRIDAIWRLTHRDVNDGMKVDNFAVNFAFALTF